MMGHTHALTGFAAGAAALPLVPVSGLAGQVGWIVAVGGMALLPDLDHPQATATRTWGPATKLVAHGLGAVTGGHRGGTHDPLLAPLVFAGLAFLAGLTLPGRVVLFAAAIGLAISACHLAIPDRPGGSAALNVAASGLGGWWLATHADAFGWLPFAVGLGVFTHIVGDLLTDSGVPLPLTWATARSRRLSLPMLTTGGGVERYLLGPVLLILVGWLAWTRLDIAAGFDQLAHTLAFGGLW